MGKAGKKAVKNEPLKGITKISVKGFKSLAKETSIDIKPLTILAGANNSGKSSIMQPLLMMKQTMEDVTDPVSDLSIEGTHVKFNTPDEFLSKINGRQKTGFSVRIGLNTKLSIIINLKLPEKNPLILLRPCTTAITKTSLYVQI